MNTTASFSSEPSWSRRGSTETIFSIQGKETDFVRDTSDTEWYGSDDEVGVEYEPATEPEDNGPVSGTSSGHSDNEIITTKVIEVSVGDDGELQLADSELTTSSSDSEMDLHDYWLCAHCRAQNNNPLYRYCEKCFKERKNFFPPRPKRKRKRSRNTKIEPETLPRTFSQDSGVESVANSQELSQNDLGQSSQNSLKENSFDNNSQTSVSKNILLRNYLKRKAESLDRFHKRIKIDYSDSESDSDSNREEKSRLESVGVKSFVKMFSYSKIDIDSSRENSFLNNGVEIKLVKLMSDPEIVIDSNLENSILKSDVEIKAIVKTESDSEINIDSSRRKSMLKTDVEVKSLVKMISDPSLTVEDPTDVKLTKKVIINKIQEKLDIDTKENNMCIVCLTEPKSGVFVHGRIAHICCCYKCAVKVWSKAKRCPVCNCKVSNVLKAITM